MTQTRASARPATHQIAEELVHVDIVGNVDGSVQAPRKAAVDTIWIADWTFDGAGGCDDSGWEYVDNRVLNDGEVHWRVDDPFDRDGGIVGNAAIVSGENMCWENPTGYCNDWYQAIRIEYSAMAPSEELGGQTRRNATPMTKPGRGRGRKRHPKEPRVREAFLSFDYLLDSEPGFDFLRVEVDSACASFNRVDYTRDPSASPRDLRHVLFSDDGLDLAGRVETLRITDFADSLSTHCLYISFWSDEGFAPCDGLQQTKLGVGAVIDNIEVVGDMTLTEDFEGELAPGVTLVNLHSDKPFGQWGRVYQHITDNDHCTENRTCAVLWTDDQTPTVATHPSMFFGPGGYVVRGWLDNVLISPWVSLATTPDPLQTVIQFRRFPGNFFRTSNIVQNWSVRGKKFVDGGSGEATECLSAWGHAFQWSGLSFFGWLTTTRVMTSDFDHDSDEIQIRYRVSDWQYLVGAPRAPTDIRGPGPYTDRTRIGRIVADGPLVSAGRDARTQAQDAFPTVIHPEIPTDLGEHFAPSGERFGTAAFSPGTEAGPSSNRFPVHLITGDSITVQVDDQRNTGGITSVDWYGAIVAGPHVGKSPPPYTVGSNGFFRVVPERAFRLHEEWFFVDLDDDYFRGGDVVNYFWIAQDAHGGVTSLPEGMHRVPSMIEEAHELTGGLFEVNFLPTIAWDPGYLARVAADPHGDIEPTEAEIAGSQQETCILYVQHVNYCRRAGDFQRTSFMYTLDQLGYRGRYDVYDHSGRGTYTANDLAGRATVEQAQGYSLIVYDTGNNRTALSTLPDDADIIEGKDLNQARWFRDWLDAGSRSEAGAATLWIVGGHLAGVGLHETPSHTPDPIYRDYLGVEVAGADREVAINPDVEGEQVFAFRVNAGTRSADFTTNRFALTAGCFATGGIVNTYDRLRAVGTAVETHRFTNPDVGLRGEAAIVMNTNGPQRWNTIMQSHAWFDLAVPPGDAPNPGGPRAELAGLVLNAVLPEGCAADPAPTDVREDDETGGAELPRVTALRTNVPNPFNPVTTIYFDVAREQRVSLRVYDVSGRLVRTLVEGPMARERHQVVWDGLDDGGRGVASGVYVVRLAAGDVVDVHKVVVMR